MDRLEFRSKFSERVEKFRLDDFDADLHLRPLSALERAQIIDKHTALGKIQNGDNSFEKLTIEAQCFIVSRGLVNESGNRIYKDEELRELAEEVPGKVLDAISNRILTISGMTEPQENVAKNSEPAPNAGSNYASH